MIELSIHRDGALVRKMQLTPGPHQIGRSDDNEIVLADSEVSRHHARLIVDADGTALIEDLDSGNGVLVEGRAITRHPLRVGETAEITPYLLSVTTLATPPSLVIVEGKPEGKRYLLSEDALSIGRGEDQDIALDDHGASRSHAILVLRDGHWAIRDVGSANGMFVNGEEVRDTLLSHGDTVLIGETLLRFEDPRAPQREALWDAIEEDDAPTTPDAYVPPPIAAEPAPPAPAAPSPAQDISATALLPLLLAMGALLLVLGMFIAVIFANG